MLNECLYFFKVTGRREPAQPQYLSVAEKVSLSTDQLLTDGYHTGEKKTTMSNTLQSPEALKALQQS